MPETGPTQRISLRRSLVVAAFTLVLGALLAFIVALYALVIAPVGVELATSQLREASGQVEGRLRTLVDRVEAIARLNHDWGQGGLIDIDQPEHFNALFQPLLARGPQLSSMVVANASGRELLLLRVGDDRWLNRLTDPIKTPGRARFLAWGADGKLQSDEVKPLDYDARTRPWFKGGMGLASDADIFWSEPYTFRSSNEPGLSVVVRWTAAGGVRHAMTCDIKLIDLSRFTRDIVAGRNGFVTVFTQDGKVVGIPRAANLANDEAMKAAVLKQADALDVAPLSEGYRRWRKEGAADNHLLRFSVDGQAWLATFKRSQFGTQTFWVATMAPLADFAPAWSKPVQLGVVIALASLLLAWLAAGWLAKRFTGPLAERAQQSELAEARAVADAATRAKAEFLANMSHEIRTPMNAILGMTDLALRSELSTRQRGYLQKARASADSLLGILNDILDFSKIEAGKLDLEAREFELQTVFDRVTAVVGLKAQQKGLELLMNTAPEVPAVLIGDPLRLEQVLINLCTNAVKFTETGEIVVVTVRAVLAARDRVTLRFSVRDTGLGMNDVQVSGLFQPFKQLDASTTRQFGGTGLGLAICKQLVTLMGGEIGVKSQPGRGSDFFFTAGFGLPPQPEAPAYDEQANATRRVLVIDDSANSREIFQGLLAALGYRATLVVSGAQGLAELRRAQAAREPYDVLLLDWKMPELDGFEVARLIRQDTSLKPAPQIILVTAYGDEDLPRRAAKERLNGCLSKPVSSSTLHDAIVSAMGVPAATTAAEVGAAVGVPASLGRRRVLLVEDNEFNQLVAAELLRDVAHMEVTVAPNGQVAVDLLRGAAGFDLVLMDVQMPVMDGLQATRLIRQEPTLGQLPIIAMTAHAMLRDREKCLDAGMNDYVTKPFDPNQLFAVMARWLPAPGPAMTSPTGVAEGEAISFELGLKGCLGRTELYDRILRRFFDARAGDAALVQACLASNDSTQLAAIAHTMVSNAGTIGALALSDAARRLQQAVDADERSLWPDLAQAFSHQHARVMAALLARFNSQPPTFS